MLVHLDGCRGMRQIYPQTTAYRLEYSASIEILQDFGGFESATVDKLEYFPVGKAHSQVGKVSMYRVLGRAGTKICVNLRE